MGLDLTPYMPIGHSSADMERIAAAFRLLSVPTPAARVFHNAAQSIASGVPTVLAFNSERYDTDTMHDTVTNNSRITVQTVGIYQFNVELEWAASIANAAGAALIFRKNGTTTIGRKFIGSIDDREWTVACPPENMTTVGDYVEVLVTQNTGGAVNVNSTGNHTPEFSAIRVG